MICSECEHGIFNELWGDYKCKILERHVYPHEGRAVKCKDFKEIKKEKKNDQA